MPCERSKGVLNGKKEGKKNLKKEKGKPEHAPAFFPSLQSGLLFFRLAAELAVHTVQPRSDTNGSSWNSSISWYAVLLIKADNIIHG